MQIESHDNLSPDPPACLTHDNHGGEELVYALIDETSTEMLLDAARGCSHDIGLTTLEASRFCLALSEAAVNAVRYGGGGYATLRRTENGLGLEAVIQDHGPGIASLDQAIVDGFTTTPTSLGLGIGAAKRAVEYFDIQSRPGKGTKVTLRSYPKIKRPIQIGAVSLPDTMQQVNGDYFFYHEREGDTLLLGLVDGLGEGIKARQFAVLATKAIEDDYTQPLEALARTAERAIKQQQGAGATLALTLIGPNTISAITVGDTATRVVDDHRKTHLHLTGGRGFLGMHGQAKIQSASCERPREPFSVICSTDGLTDHWASDEVPSACQAQDIANHLMDQYRRPHGDSTVVVIKEP